MSRRDWEQQEHRGTVRRRDDYDENWDYSKRRRYDVSIGPWLGPRKLIIPATHRTVTIKKIMHIEKNIRKTRVMTIIVMIITMFQSHANAQTMTGEPARSPWKRILINTSPSMERVEEWWLVKPVSMSSSWVWTPTLWNQTYALFQRKESLILTSSV